MNILDTIRRFSKGHSLPRTILNDMLPPPFFNNMNYLLKKLKEATEFPTYGKAGDSAMPIALLIHYLPLVCQEKCRMAI